MAKLLGGDADHILRANVAAMRGEGVPEHHAWRIALRKAKKVKKMQKVIAKVARPPKLKLEGK